MEATFARHTSEIAILPANRPTAPLTNATYLARARNGVIMHAPYPKAALISVGVMTLEFFMHACQAFASSGVNSNFYN